MEPKFTLVLPTYKEAGNMAGLLPRVRGALDATAIAYQVLLVDDDSGDHLDEAVAAAVPADPRFRVVTRRGERGLTGAVLSGWSLSDSPWLGVMDADGQHPPEVWPQMLAAMDSGADLVVGSRYIPGGSVEGWPWNRRLVSWMGTVATRLALPKHATRTPDDPAAGMRRASDPMSGMFAVRRAVTDAVPWRPAGFKLLLQLLMHAPGLKIVEVPLPFAPRQAGESKISMKSLKSDFATLVHLYRARGRR